MREPSVSGGSMGISEALRRFQGAVEGYLKVPGALQGVSAAFQVVLGHIMRVPGVSGAS